MPEMLETIIREQRNISSVLLMLRLALEDANPNLATFAEALDSTREHLDRLSREIEDHQRGASSEAE